MQGQRKLQNKTGTGTYDEGEKKKGRHFEGNARAFPVWMKQKKWEGAVGSRLKVVPGFALTTYI